MKTTTLQMTLIEALRRRDVEAALAALAAGADVNAKARYGCSAYPQAESYGNAELCRMLQERGIETEHH